MKNLHWRAKVQTEPSSIRILSVHHKFQSLWMSRRPKWQLNELDKCDLKLYNRWRLRTNFQKRVQLDERIQQQYSLYWRTHGVFYESNKIGDDVRLNAQYKKKDLPWVKRKRTAKLWFLCPEFLPSTICNQLSKSHAAPNSRSERFH